MKVILKVATFSLLLLGFSINDVENASIDFFIKPSIYQ